ncbi:MAG TPA: DUF262 domain-containing protein [Pseudonocardiaceae bacterium]|nr:DUF262 domain-containing protein [Pseudonocardiaceae bacterium]
MTGALDTQPNASTFVLDDLVKWAWSGQIRVPHFQRGLRWDRSDVVRLFDSILNGYPIGNLLLWVRNSPAQEVTLGRLVINAPASNDAFWVVDGQQRITSLANALHPSGTADPRFALAYDMDRRQVVPQSSRSDPATIPLPVIFDLQSLIRWQIDHPEFQDRIDEASAITKRLREFSIPVYLVRQDDPKILQVIFDRMNNSGKKLTRAEVFSALYAGQEEQPDDTLSIKVIADRISTDLGFGLIDEDTVLRALLARRGSDVEREIRLEFNIQDRKGSIDFPDEDRDTAFQLGEQALRSAVTFLQDHAGIPHISMLPYRYLLVVLTRYLSFDLEPDPRDARLLRRWFWRSAMSGPTAVKGSTTATTRTLNGLIRPDRHAEAVQALLATTPGFAENGLPDLQNFRTNTASTKIVLASWWHQQPRSVRNGTEHTRSDLSLALDENSTARNVITSIVHPAAIPDEYRNWAAGKMFLIGQDEEIEDLDNLITNHGPLAHTELRTKALESHSINEGNLQQLQDGDIVGFLISRQMTLAAKLRRFLMGMCESSFEDTPSLADLVFDESPDEHADS